MYKLWYMQFHTINIQTRSGINTTEVSGTKYVERSIMYDFLWKVKFIDGKYVFCIAQILLTFTSRFNFVFF